MRTLVFASLFLLGACSSPSTPVDASSGSDAFVSADAGIDGSSALDTGPAVDTGACHMPTDLSGIDANCGPMTECPAGYVCQQFSGAILSMSCQISCDPAGCPCPAGTSCGMHSDKTGVPWFQCDPDA
jgi:hypothetical protein